MVRLSEEEKKQLEQYRDSVHSKDKALGSVISSLLFKEQVIDQKKILITGTGREEQYPNTGNASYARIVARPAGKDGKNIRGYGADLVILLTELPEDVRKEVIEPMQAQIIELY